MTLDEALAVYVYLKDRAGDRNVLEESAFKTAWDTICQYAKEAIKREAHSR